MSIPLSPPDTNPVSTVIDFWYSGYIFISRYIGPTDCWPVPQIISEPSHTPTAFVFMLVSLAFNAL